MNLVEALVSSAILSSVVLSSVQLTSDSLRATGKATDTDAVMAQMSARAEVIRHRASTFLCSSGCFGDPSEMLSYGKDSDSASHKDMCESETMGEGLLAYLAEVEPQALAQQSVRGVATDVQVTPNGNLVEIRQSSSKNHQMITVIVPPATAWCP